MVATTTVRGRDGKDKAVCGTLCMCLAVSVMSAVALVYLTVIIYLPAQRELQSGIRDSSVMCTTIEKKDIVDDIFACRWSSCSEWCLSKGGSACTHLFVRDGFFFKMDHIMIAFEEKRSLYF